MDVRFVGIDNVVRPVKWLVDTSSIRIAMFHGCHRLLPKFLKSGLVDERTYLYFTFAWYQNGFEFADIRRAVDGAMEQNKNIEKQIVLFVNSHVEYETAKSIVGNIEVRIVNNNCFLRHELYRADDKTEKTFDAVMIARATAFKRHHLAKKISKVAYVANDWGGGAGDFAAVDIAALSPAAHFKQLKLPQVIDLINDSYVGLILSEFEGACYSAVEYLLCGTPVVSTPSFGGRDEFFVPLSSIIAPAQQDDIRFAAAALKKKVVSGELAAHDVRKTAIERIQFFRDTALSSFGRKMEQANVSGSLLNETADKIALDHKLSENMNFFVADVLA